MIRGIESVLLFSANAKKLAKFYREVVGLKQAYTAEMGSGDEIYGYEWKGSSGLSIIDHSKVVTKSKQPERFIINFEVDDIEREFKRLVKAKVKVIADIYHVQEYGRIATFEDIDGNYFQFVQVRAN